MPAWVLHAQPLGGNYTVSGTLSAKCHFTQYRFSEELDFTALGTITEPLLVRIADEAKKAMHDSIGVRTSIN